MVARTCGMWAGWTPDTLDCEFAAHMVRACADGGGYKLSSTVTMLAPSFFGDGYECGGQAEGLAE